MDTLHNCPICSESALKAFLDCQDFTVSRETFQVVQCESCGFRFTNPRPGEDEVGKYYQAEEYISHSDTNKGLINKLYLMVRSYTIGKKVGLINRLTEGQKSASKNLLDIGCGTAEFLHASKVNGWNVMGIEPSEIARKNAEQKYAIRPLPQEKLFEVSEQFNAITLWHVLEHVHQIDRTIEHVKKLLIDDGILIIAVPNCNSWDAVKYGKYWAAWDVPRHLYHFTKMDIEGLFNRHGFRLSEVLPMKFDSYYVSLLSEKYKTGRSNLLAGFINGIRSNLAAKKLGFSSQIYILKKEVI